MHPVYLTNTLTKEKELLQPLADNKVSFYHCGPTVYWVQHIGNGRAMTLADFMHRTLNFLGYQTILVRNYTDVGHLTGDNIGDAESGTDRMEVAAKRENKTPDEIAAFYIEQFERDMDRLNILEPAHTPRATEHINDMIDIVQTLLEKGFAYQTDLAIYFDISKKADYTKLSGQNLQKLCDHAGHGSVTDPDKRNQHDFSLWFFKAGQHAKALQTWPSPFTSPHVSNGEGFPGWHIECSAMAMHFLGATLDIHMGGVEHIPVHHTNEIAQSEGVTGKPFASIWLHNEHLLIDGGKMSKSAGTAYLLDDIIGKGFDPLDLRYFFLMAHYRSMQNFTWEALQAAKAARLHLVHTVRDWQNHGVATQPSTMYLDLFKDALADDMNTPKALAVTHKMLKDLTLSTQERLKTLLVMDEVLGLNLQSIQPLSIPGVVRELLEKRRHARDQRDWAAADTLRDEIQSHGFVVRDTSDGQRVDLA